jgi:hypothetical protein
MRAFICVLKVSMSVLVPSVERGVRGLRGSFPFARECGDFFTVSLYGDGLFCCLPWLISNGVAPSAGGTFFLLGLRPRPLGRPTKRTFTSLREDVFRQKETTERKRRPRTIRRCCASVPCVAQLPPGAAELATACLRSDSPRPDPSSISATRLTPRGQKKYASLRSLKRGP